MTLWHFWRTHAAEFASLFGQHVLLVGISTLVAIAAGVPIGILAARRPRAGAPIVWLANVVQTIPSLAMFGFLLPLPLVGGLGARVAIFVLILYALLPIVRTTVAGLRSVDRVLVEAGTALGMTPWQLLREVELPLALPSIVAGIRVAAVIGVGTATIAAAVGAGGLGEYIFRGLSMVDPTVILAGAIPSAVLALTIDGALTALERVLKTRQRPGRRRAPAWLLVAGRAADRGRADRGVRAEGRHGRHPRRLEELHRADHPRRAGRAGHRGARTAGRAPPESRRHVHLRSRAALGRHRRLRRVHRDGADGDLPAAGRYRFAPGARARQGALRRSRADAARSARVREHVRHPGPGRGRQTARPAHHRRSGGARAPPWQAGFGYEFLQRQDGYPGLARTYGLRFAAPPTAMDLSLIYRALAERQVDLIAGDATSGLIEAYDLVMLEDDRHYFPPYDAVPVARRRCCWRIRRSARR